MTRRWRPSSIMNARVGETVRPLSGPRTSRLSVVRDRRRRQRKPPAELTTENGALDDRSSHARIDQASDLDQLATARLHDERNAADPVGGGLPPRSRAIVAGPSRQPFWRSSSEAFTSFSDFRSTTGERGSAGFGSSCAQVPLWMWTGWEPDAPVLSRHLCAGSLCHHILRSHR